MIEIKFFLELLACLLTDPSGLDRRAEFAKIRIGRQVRHIVFLLASRPMFSDDPVLVTRYMLHTISAYNAYDHPQHAGFSWKRLLDRCAIPHPTGDEVMKLIAAH